MPRRPLNFPSFTACLAVVGVLVLFAGLPLLGHAQHAPSDTTRLTFNESIRVALDQNTTLKRSQASLRQSETQVRSEMMDFSPDLSLNSSFSRRFGRNFSQIEGEIVTQSTDFLNMGVSSGITLFNGFENVASLRRARSENRASELDVRRTRRKVVFTVMEQYITLIENREIVRVRREELEARRKQLQQIKEFVDAGSRPVSDLYQEQANVAEAEQQLLQAQRDREVSKTQLIQTLQLEPSQSYHFETPDVSAEELTTQSYDMSALMKQAFEHRLDLRVAEVERQAAEHGIRSARSSYYPSVSISGSYGTDWTSRARRIPDPETGQPVQPSFRDQLDNNRSGSLSLRLSFPIFSQWQRETQVEQAQVQAQNAQYDLQDQRQQVALEVRQAYLDYQNAVQQLEAANKRLKAAKQSRAAVQERYNLGSASIVELQNATRTYVEAASQQVRARYNLVFQQKRIDYNVGRLNPDEPLLGQQ